MTIQEFAEFADANNLISCYVAIIEKDSVQLEKICGFNFESNRFYPVYGTLCLGEINWSKFIDSLTIEIFDDDCRNVDVFVKYNGIDYPVSFEDFGEGFGFALGVYLH